MNLIQYAISEIKNTIPYDILNLAMAYDEKPEVLNLTSLEFKIEEKIIKNRVATDANIVGGIEILIPLTSVSMVAYENYYCIFDIPAEARNNKEIMSVLGLGYLPNIGFLGFNSINSQPFGIQNLNNANSLVNVIDKVGTSYSDVGLMNNTHTELIGNNRVLIYAAYRSIINHALKCRLENNENFSNIQPRSYKSFSLMCILATKAYIYNKLIVALNSGFLQAGQELGVVKQIIEGYESAEEEYRTYITEKWTKIALMNDTTSHHNFLRSMINPGI